MLFDCPLPNGPSPTIIGLGIRASTYRHRKDAFVHSNDRTGKLDEGLVPCCGDVGVHLGAKGSGLAWGLSQHNRSPGADSSEEEPLVCVSGGDRRGE